MADMNIKDTRAPKTQGPQKGKVPKAPPKVSGGTGSNGKLYMNTDKINSVSLGGSWEEEK